MAAPVALVPAAVATCVVAGGWLYMTGPGQWIPGPRIGEALPLDELSHHAGAPVLLFVVVWAAAGAVLGLVGRLVGIDRLTAGLLLALLVGMVVYVDTAISIATVRQIPAQHAFDHAAGLPAVYLAAALAGLGGALLGHVRVSGRRAATVLATAVAAAGALDILRALLPGSHAIVGGLAPDAVQFSGRGIRGAGRCGAAPLGAWDRTGEADCVVDGNHAVDGLGLAARASRFQRRRNPRGRRARLARRDAWGLSRWIGPGRATPGLCPARRHPGGRAAVRGRRDLDQPHGCRPALQLRVCPARDPRELARCGDRASGGALRRVVPADGAHPRRHAASRGRSPLPSRRGGTSSRRRARNGTSRDRS